MTFVGGKEKNEDSMSCDLPKYGVCLGKEKDAAGLCWNASSNLFALLHESAAFSFWIEIGDEQQMLCS